MIPRQKAVVEDIRLSVTVRGIAQIDLLLPQSFQADMERRLVHSSADEIQNIAMAKEKQGGIGVEIPRRDVALEAEALKEEVVVGLWRGLGDFAVEKAVQGGTKHNVASTADLRHLPGRAREIRRI